MKAAENLSLRFFLEPKDLIGDGRMLIYVKITVTVDDRSGDKNIRKKEEQKIAYHEFLQHILLREKS